MKLKVLLVLFVLAGVAGSVAAQQVKKLRSPEQFLGYKPGTRYTPHWKVVDYCREVADAAPLVARMTQYGETNEGRPLMLVVVSSEENMNRLDAIRNNNQRLANLSRDKAAPVEENAPAIVWLSYNVHGNETSSSEAAMLTLYALVNPAETKTKEWLRNTVVIIDPCLNPDGRDRYVNWYNMVTGKEPNPLRMAREHREPWPGGRTNHYNFDLNRDWAWQTQVESQQRAKVYNVWMPQVHVDFHEQGVNDPYYFAPAAQPYHDVITPWQREFQVALGKNHAKYFDANGWLYFTKEVFDLYYPSYGDTYPTYNGAIGMTYEQGGGPSGGRAVLNDEGDTLTLLDRVTHHFTTSLSTIETSSLHSAKLIKEFRKFFNEAVSSGSGEYKSYVIRNKPADKERIQSLLALLDKNGIRYEAVNGAGKGFSYFNDKEENFTAANDILVSTYQPKAAMVRVLFEPKGRLVDSATYDITAWALPYAYGLEAWACRDRLNGSGAVQFTTTANEETNYGYIIPWNGITSANLVGQLLKKGILLRYAEQPFEVNGNKFDRGAILVLKTANRSFGNALWTEVRKEADALKVKLYPVSTGFVDKGFDFGSDKVHPFKAPKVAMMTGEGISAGGAGEIWHFFENELNYPLTLINAADAGRADWNNIDVLIMPDGNYRFLTDKAQTEAFKEWISKGGRVVALESAIGALAKAEIGIKLKKAEDTESKDSYDALKRYEERERDALRNFNPGAIFRVDMDNSHPLAYGYPPVYHTLKMDDAVYDFFKGDGWNVGVIKKESQVAGFAGSALKSRLKDGLLFGSQPVGNGTVTYLTDNVMFRSFWQNGKLMLCNAVFLVGN